MRVPPTLSSWGLRSRNYALNFFVCGRVIGIHIGQSPKSALDILGLPGKAASRTTGEALSPGRDLVQLDLWENLFNAPGHPPSLRGRGAGDEFPLFRDFSNFATVQYDRTHCGPRTEIGGNISNRHQEGDWSKKKKLARRTVLRRSSCPPPHARRVSILTFSHVSYPVQCGREPKSRIYRF